MKRLILISMVCLMTIVTQAQNEVTAGNDSVAWDKMLNEISVTGHRHIVRMKGNTLVAQVANTELANLGTANDVLSRLPFINMDGDEISIVGKGKPQVFIDNRPVRNESELQMLRSENIKNIQIITSPGAEYSSDVKAVIKIQTKQPFIKGLSGKLTSQTTAKRIWEETAMADLSYNWTHWQLFGQAMYNNGGRKNYDTSTTDFLFNNQQNQLVNTATKRNKLSTTTAKGGFNWNDGGQSLGAYYQYTNSPTHFKSRGTEDDNILGVETESIGKLIDIDSKSERHLVSAYYDNAFKNGSLLHFDGNYMHTWYTDDNLTQTIFASGIGNEIVPSQTGMNSDLWAGKLYYEFPFATGKLNVGTEDSYTYNNQRYTMQNETVGSYIPSTQNESRQHNYAAFATYSKDWDALSLQLGLRWEYVKFDYKRDGIRDDEVSRTDNSLSPNLSLSYNFDETTFMSLDYSHSITRPPYKQLRSSLLYVGPYEVEGGNPTLTDCKTDELTYLFGWKDLTLELTYSHLADTYVYTKEHYSDVNPLLIFSPRQADINNLNAYLSYAPVVKFWKPNFTVGFDQQWLTLYGEKYNKPIFRYMLKNIFTPSKDWMMTFDVTGSTRGHTMTNEMRSQWGIDLSVRRYFMQKRLQIALAANDIFHTRNQSWWMNVKDVHLYKDSDADSRRVMLTVSYTFNPKKSRYKGKTADEKEMKRL
jgi:outer membrane receptor protein involved in Fe transport